MLIRLPKTLQGTMINVYLTQALIRLNSNLMLAFLIVFKFNIVIELMLAKNEIIIEFIPINGVKTINKIINSPEPIK